MKTVIETPSFQRQADAIWTDSEREDFIAYIAANPEAGDLIQGGQGARKVRWKEQGKGKSGGVRVIYFIIDDDHLTLVYLYRKADRSNVTADKVRRMQK